MITSDLLPLFKTQLRERFGYLAFNCVLINVDIIGIRSLKTGEGVIITYRGDKKTGFIYEGDKLTLAQQLTFFTDAPDSYSELGKFEKEMQGRIEILVPPKDNYVFVDDRVVKPNNSK